MNLIGNKIIDKIQKSQELQHQIVPNKLKVKQKIQDFIKEYLKNDTYL